MLLATYLGDIRCSALVILFSMGWGAMSRLQVHLWLVSSMVAAAAAAAAADKTARSVVAMLSSHIRQPTQVSRHAQQCSAIYQNHSMLWCLKEGAVRLVKHDCWCALGPTWDQSAHGGCGRAPDGHC